MSGGVTGIHIWYLKRILGIHEIGRNCYISRKAKLDKINPGGIHIGNNVWILSRVAVLTHDHSRSLVKPTINRSKTFIGDNTIIGIQSVILPAVKIGRHCVVAAGSIVTNDIPDGCMVAGNPARIIRRNIRVNDWGQIMEYGEKQERPQ